MAVRGRVAEDSWFWTYEPPFKVDIPDVEYDAMTALTQPGDSATDVIFRNGVVFGYVDREDIIDA